MGYRGKLIVQQMDIELPKSFVKKYKKEYNISKGNISSKVETKSHFEIILDLEDILDKKGSVYAAILWEDGVINRHNLSTGESDRIGNGNDEY